MESNITAFPLCWPDGTSRFHGDKGWWPKAPTPAAARDELFSELEMMKATDIILSTNVPATKGGTFYANYKEPADNGVAVYFTYKGKQRVLACDAYQKLNMNIRAISLTVTEIRRSSKRGVADFMDKVFTGFAALPPASVDSPENWWVVLECEQNSEASHVLRQYRKLAREYHPDSHLQPNKLEFIRVQEAWENFQKLKK